MHKTIGILTGGGDAPGLNAVIRSVVTTAAGQYGMKVIGIEDGFEGLLGETQTRELTIADVRGLLPRGGTILGTRNRGRFVEITREGIQIKPEAVYREAVDNINRLGIECLIVLGGEGTLGIAMEFDNRGVPVVGVPKTIDNDRGRKGGRRIALKKQCDAIFSGNKKELRLQCQRDPLPTCSYGCTFECNLNRLKGTSFTISYLDITDVHARPRNFAFSAEYEEGESVDAVVWQRIGKPLVWNQKSWNTVSRLLGTGEQHQNGKQHHREALVCRGHHGPLSGGVVDVFGFRPACR